MQIPELIQRGLAIRAEIKALQAKLAEIEEKVCETAVGSPHLHVDLNDPDRDGRQCRFESTGGKIVPVVLTADELVASFADGSPKHAAIANAAGEQHFHELFRRKVSYERGIESGKKFRARCHALMPAEQAVRVITATIARDKAGVPKSKVFVAWDRAE